MHSAMENMIKKMILLCLLILSSQNFAMESSAQISKTTTIYRKLVAVKLLQYGFGVATLFTVLCPWVCLNCELDSTQVCCCLSK